MTVNQLETNARFVGFLLVRSADARTDKKGGAYLDLTLADKTGDINCKYWDWNQLMDVPKQGSVIKVQGLVQEYNSRKQLRIERMRAALPQDEVDMAQLVACAPEKPEVMRKDIEDTIDTFQSEGLKKIVREMLRLPNQQDHFDAQRRRGGVEGSDAVHRFPPAGGCRADSVLLGQRNVRRAPPLLRHHGAGAGKAHQRFGGVGGHETPA